MKEQIVFSLSAWLRRMAIRLLLSTIDFSVHSVEELQDVIAHVNAIKRVDEVRRRELK